MSFVPDDDCFAIRQAARYVSQLYDRYLAKVGLTITQFSIMRRITRAGRMTMKQLADEMVMERTSLVRAVHPLRREGLVLSESLDPVQRAPVLGLTEAGMARFRAAHEHWHAAQDEFEQRFGVERAAALRRELLSMTREQV